MNFNPEQLAIIKNLKGAFLINAPVGTGKTTVLTQRVVEAVAAGFVPERILCLTFTNRAADEMRQRLRIAVKEKNIFDNIGIHTFHGWCAYFLKNEAKNLGLSADFTIMDDDDQAGLLKNISCGYEDKLSFKDGGSKNELHRLADDLYHYRLAQLEQKIGIRVTASVDPLKESLGAEYERALDQQNALDFNYLVLETMNALYIHEDLRRKWSERYDFIQLDEFQDTHLSEYLVVKELAKKSKNIALIGDLDQTIYSWRGSQPQKISAVFKQHFAPVQELSLRTNYRSRPELLMVVKKVLNGFSQAATQAELLNSNRTDSESTDDCLHLFNGHDFKEEIEWVIERVKILRQENPEQTIAVLSRSHGLINQAAEIFVARNVPHLTVDHYNFFRRQEIKDALAHLKILFNRFDLDSAYRLAARPPKDLGEKTLDNIRQNNQDAGLRISDFLYLPNFSRPEPFAQLLDEYADGRLIVLDTETTGLNPARDEIIQFYAQEIINGQAEHALHCYLKNTVGVGASAAVHGLSDDFLADNGQSPVEALRQLKAFIGSSPVIGHNIKFDLSMILANGQRQGVEFEFKNFYDTLDLAKRLIFTDSYKLSALAKLFNLGGATHSADEDVGATIELLAILTSKLSLHRQERVANFGLYAKKFIRLASQITNWQHIIANERPALAVAKIIDDSGLRDYYASLDDGDKRLAGLESLIKFFGQHDQLNATPFDSLRDGLNLAALSKNIDFLALDQGQIPILTIHQAKGLEFDHVFLLGLNEGQMPFFKTTDQEEERRLFYVAVTRARRSINLSYANFDRYGRPMAKSRFLTDLG